MSLIKRNNLQIFVSQYINHKLPLDLQENLQVTFLIYLIRLLISSIIVNSFETGEKLCARFGPGCHHLRHSHKIQF